MPKREKEGRKDRMYYNGACTKNKEHLALDDVTVCVSMYAFVCVHINWALGHSTPLKKKKNREKA